MGKNRLGTTEVEQVHGIRPGIGGEINPVGSLFQAALSGIGIEHGLGHAKLQRLTCFQDATVSLKQSV